MNYESGYERVSAETAERIRGYYAAGTKFILEHLVDVTEVPKGVINSRGETDASTGQIRTTLSEDENGRFLLRVRLDTRNSLEDPRLGTASVEYIVTGSKKPDEHIGDLEVNGNTRRFHPSHGARQSSAA